MAMLNTPARHWMKLAGLIVLLLVAGRILASQPGFRSADVDRRIDRHAAKLVEEGRDIFRFDTFGDEEFWGDQLRLHEAIAGEDLGGVGPGVKSRYGLGAGSQGRCKGSAAPVETSYSAR